MRLRDLDAEFVGHWQPKSYRRLGDRIVDGVQGLLFQCPKCAIGLEPGEEDGRRFFRGAHYILCWFSNPRGSPPAPATLNPTPRWTLESGMGIDDLTISPSILIIGGCAWHGFVKNGDAT